MFQAIGRGVQKNSDNTITVKVEFLDDRTGRQQRVETYTVDSIESLRKRVTVDLQALKAADQDFVLTNAVVGVIIAEI